MKFTLQKIDVLHFFFGDGGVAALVERGECFGKSYFSLNSDGSREGLIKVDAEVTEK